LVLAVLEQTETEACFVFMIVYSL